MNNPAEVADFDDAVDDEAIAEAADFIEGKLRAVPAFTSLVVALIADLSALLGNAPTRLQPNVVEWSAAGGSFSIYWKADPFSGVFGDDDPECHSTATPEFYLVIGYCVAQGIPVHVAQPCDDESDDDLAD